MPFNSALVYGYINFYGAVKVLLRVAITGLQAP